MRTTLKANNRLNLAILGITIFMLVAGSCANESTPKVAATTSDTTITILEPIDTTEIVSAITEMTKASASETAITTVPLTTTAETTEPPEALSLIYDNSSLYFDVQDLYYFSLPESKAKSLINYKELEKIVSKYIDETTDTQTLTTQTWRRAFDDKGYFAVDDTGGVLMSSDLFLTVQTFSPDPTIPKIFDMIYESEDGTEIALVYNDVVRSHLYGATGFTGMTPIGFIDTDTKSMYSYSFSADCNMNITRAYYGYFVIAYDKATYNHSYMLITGLADITDDELLADIFLSITEQQPETLWHTFKS